MYLIEYHLTIEVPGPHGLWCQEKVRCLAADEGTAMQTVINWARVTEKIWWSENGRVAEHTIPMGKRDVAIMRIDRIMSDVGMFMKDLGLTEIMPPED